VAAEVASSVEVVGADVPRKKEKNNSGHPLLFLLCKTTQLRRELTPIKLISGGNPRMEQFVLSKSLLKLKQTIRNT